MPDKIMPEEPRLRWWQRYQAQFEIVWKPLPGALPPRSWLFHAEGHFHRVYRGYRVFWVRGIVRLLGFELGAALFRRGEKLPVPEFGAPINIGNRSIKKSDRAEGRNFVD